MICIEDPQGTAAQKLLESAHLSDCGWFLSIDVAESASRALLPPTEQLAPMSSCDPNFMDVTSVHSDLLLSKSILQSAVGLISALQGVCSSSPIVSRALRVQAQQHLTLTSTLNDKTLEELKRAVSSSSGIKPGNIAAAGAALLWQELMGQRGASPAPAAPEEVKLSAAVLLLAACGWENTAPPAVPALLGCRLCGRSFSLAQLDPADAGTAGGPTNSGLDCVAQHRYFCPYVNAPTRWPLWCCEDHSLNVSVGSASWQLGISALARVFGVSVAKTEEITPLKKRNNELQEGDEDGQAENSAITVNSEISALSPEQTYKRIRGILHESLVKPSV